MNFNIHKQKFKEVRDPKMECKLWQENLTVLQMCNINSQRSEEKSLSRVQLFETPWTVAYQAPESMEFSRQEYWSGLPFSSPGDLPNPNASPALVGGFCTTEPSGKPVLNLGELLS